MSSLPSLRSPGAPADERAGAPQGAGPGALGRRPHPGRPLRRLPDLRDAPRLRPRRPARCRAGRPARGARARANPGQGGRHHDRLLQQGPVSRPIRLCHVPAVECSGCCVRFVGDGWGVICHDWSVRVGFRVLIRSTVTQGGFRLQCYNRAWGYLVHWSARVDSALEWDAGGRWKRTLLRWNFDVYVVCNSHASREKPLHSRLEWNSSSIEDFTRLSDELLLWFRVLRGWMSWSRFSLSFWIRKEMKRVIWWIYTMDLMMDAIKVQIVRWIILNFPQCQVLVRFASRVYNFRMEHAKCFGKVVIIRDVMARK